MKEHEARELVNRLRDIAIKYHDYGCLREKIAAEIRPLISSSAPACYGAWISATDRLPSSDGMYLCWCRQSERNQFAHIFRYLDDDRIGGFADNRITHWMPLPDAP